MDCSAECLDYEQMYLELRCPWHRALVLRDEYCKWRHSLAAVTDARRDSKRRWTPEVTNLREADPAEAGQAATPSPTVPGVVHDPPRCRPRCKSRVARASLTIAGA